MEEFVLIMRHEDGSKIASPEQMQIWMKQTMDWIGSIAAQNKFSGGTGLPFEDARVVQGTIFILRCSACFIKTLTTTKQSCIFKKLFLWQRHKQTGRQFKRKLKDLVKTIF